MEIIASSGGQNWQILIPISFKYKCGYIDECLFNYRESDDSHSHAITRSFVCRDSVIESINNYY